jgi:hypothetical protein
MSVNKTHWATRPDQEVEITIGKSGVAGRPALTVIECLHKTVEKFGNEKAMCLKRAVDVCCGFLYRFLCVSLDANWLWFGC